MGYTFPDKRVLTGVVFVTLLLSATTLLAQVDPQRGQLLLAGNQISVGIWSVNEKLIEVSLDSANFKHLDVVTGQFVPLPSSAYLTEEEIAVFGIDVNNSTVISSQYAISPDGVYVAYRVRAGLQYRSEEDGTCKLWQLRVANRQRMVAVDLPFVVGVSTGFRWGGNSRGFIIDQTEGCEGLAINGPIAYVWNLLPVLTGVEVTRIDDLTELDVEYADVQLHAISSDGLWLLASAIDPSESLLSAQITLVNVADHTETLVITEKVEGLLTASFEYGMPTSIRLLGKSGLVAMSLEGQQQVLNPLLKTTGDRADWSPDNFVREAAFSPSGRWLVYTHFDELAGIEQLYLFDIKATPDPRYPKYD